MVFKGRGELMPVAASEYFYMKAKKKLLTIELEEGEDVFKSIKEAMRQHNVKECSVDTMDGLIKKGMMNTLNGSKYSAIKLENTMILNASGNFKLSFEELFGGLHVLAKVSKPISGTFASGVAGNGLKIRLSFYEHNPMSQKQPIM